ncbi:replication initiation protein (plasmid) [Methylobacterium indicum]|uniref:Replication initiation protein n=2 Tax=Methylobacterium indicum TaxID=1775910 RepID=A0A8H8X0S6_9HYPH|nr:replication initiation protein [Methylobacterium indicum]
MTVHKWTVFRDVAAARRLLGLNDRAVAVLDALLTFYPETALSTAERNDLIVFPSNASLALRAHGIAEATLRRSLAALIEAGLIIRRDSPNGKRYIRRDQSGTVAQAYGFDLSPLVARAAELAGLAEKVRADVLALRVLRERVTLLRRDCSKMVVALEEAGEALGGANPVRCRFSEIVGALPRRPTVADLDQAADALTDLAIDLSNLLISHQERPEANANPDQDDRHIQSSNPEVLDCEPAPGLGQAEAPWRGEGRAAPVEALPARITYPLGFVIETCPDISNYTRTGIRSWSDLAGTADLVSSALGISQAAWREAQEVMGQDGASVAVAAILQRADHIRCPGAYLRALVERKRMGKFSLGPMLQALIRAKLVVSRPRKPVR